MNEYFDFQFSEEKKIYAVINGKEYTFGAFFSFKDYEIITYKLENNNCEYKDIVAELVLNHIYGDNIDCLKISSLPEKLLLRYIEEIIKDSKLLSAIYEDKDYILDVYERFVVSIKENLHHEIESMRESFANIKLPNIIAGSFQQPMTLNLNLSSTISNIKELIPDMSVLTEGFSQISQSIMDTHDIMRNISESCQAMIEMQQIFLKQILKNVAHTLAQLPTLSYTEEEIEKIRQNLCKWGEYGWTLPEHVIKSEFMVEPMSVKEANDIAARHYCTKEYMQKIFEEINGFGCVRKSDFYEAVDNYNDKRYKSCACIIFSLIDAKLIRMQPKNNRGKSDNRSVGMRAVKKSKKKLLSISSIENNLFAMLRLENVYSCMMKFFEHGNNFEKQPEVINRNFLLHGMLTRQVTKRDCNQLFMLYYNWLSLLEIY